MDNDNRPRVRLDSPKGIAAAVPSLVGFVPDDGSIVLVTVRGSRIGLVARVDWPGVHGSDRLARQLADTVKSGQPDTTSAHLIGWGTAVGDVDTLWGDLRVHGVEVHECLTVQDRDGVPSVLDTCADIAEPRWEPLGDDPVRHALVEVGATVADSRAELAERIAPGGAPDAFDERVLDQLADVQFRDERLGALAHLTPEELLAVREFYARLARTGTGDARSAALCLVATASYLVGDGAMVDVALTAVPDGYRLAVLLQAMYAALMPPALVREALREAF